MGQLLEQRFSAVLDMLAEVVSWVEQGHDEQFRCAVGGICAECSCMCMDYARRCIQYLLKLICNGKGCTVGLMNEAMVMLHKFARNSVVARE